jgi:hypothetical protein
MTAVVDGRPGETPTIARGACGGRRGGLGGKAARADRSGDAPTKSPDRAVLSTRDRCARLRRENQALRGEPATADAFDVLSDVLNVERDADMFDWMPRRAGVRRT